MQNSSFILLCIFIGYTEECKGENGMGKTHPSIEQFKNFVKNHPGLIIEVRKGSATWQELFEEWYLLGENDPKWTKYNKYIKEEEPKQETKKENNLTGLTFNQIMNYIKKLDIHQLQQYLGQMSDAIASLQNLLAQMNETNQNGENPDAANSQQRRSPFSFRKD